MVNQLLAGVHIATAAEAMALGARAGLDTRQLYDIISKAAGSSWWVPCRMRLGHITFISGADIGKERMRFKKRPVFGTRFGAVFAMEDRLVNGSVETGLEPRAFSWAGAYEGFDHPCFSTVGRTGHSKSRSIPLHGSSSHCYRERLAFECSCILKSLF
jgi:hypothetical protein